MIQVCKQEAMPFHHFKCFVRGADERFETLIVYLSAHEQRT